MNDQNDIQLLRAYAQHHSESAFSELVQRHVDLVYSAALRMVCDSHAAKDVTQGVFVALAQNARQLTDRPALAGWLYCTARNLSAKLVRSEVRRRTREQEVAAMNEMDSADSDVHWEHIKPLLDEALSALDDMDRDVLLLRYFKNCDLRTVGRTLGISDDAAQKRVSRAVERLRQFFANQGITASTSGLVAVISANAVQAAPAGLVAAISLSSAFAGTTAITTTAILMTTLQKTVIGAALIAAVGTGIYEVRQVTQPPENPPAAQRKQTPVSESVRLARTFTPTPISARRPPIPKNESMPTNEIETNSFKEPFRYPYGHDQKSYDHRAASEFLLSGYRDDAAYQYLMKRIITNNICPGYAGEIKLQTAAFARLREKKHFSPEETEAIISKGIKYMIEKAENNGFLPPLSDEQRAALTDIMNTCPKPSLYDVPGPKRTKQYDPGPDKDTPREQYLTTADILKYIEQHPAKPLPSHPAPSQN